MRNNELIASIMEFQAAVGIGLQFSSLHKWRSLSSLGNRLQMNQLKNYKAFWSQTQMDMRTLSTSSPPLYTAEGRKLKSFFMTTSSYQSSHSHCSLPVFLQETLSGEDLQNIGCFDSKELFLKLGSQFPWIHFICISHIKQSHSLGLWPLTNSHKWSLR